MTSAPRQTKTSMAAITARKPGRALYRALLSFGLGALVAATTAGVQAQVNVQGDTGIDASGNYQNERAWCMVNTQGDARTACLKNSAAAQAEKRRGTLDTNGNNYAANALARCAVFDGADRATCQARVLGLGNASGSVQGGGQIKEIETVVVPPGQRAIVVDTKAKTSVYVLPPVRP